LKGRLQGDVTCCPFLTRWFVGNYLPMRETFCIISQRNYMS